MITRKPVVLLAPLDWGFGHTIRCIPIIKEFLWQQWEVVVACNSEQKLLLDREVASVRFINLQGYNIYYGRSRFMTLFNLFRQGPKILTKIKSEQVWLKKLLQTTHIDAIVSDNRYGLFSKGVPCVFITHQLKIRSGLGTTVDEFVQRRLYKYINKFNACWVPDWNNPLTNAGGELSHPKNLPRIPIRYMGCLSRLEKCVSHSNAPDLLIILSGPEPQRSILESILLSQLKAYEGTAVLIRGIMNSHSIASFNNTSILNYVSSDVLNQLMCNSAVVICRAGYTSIMDILKLGKKAVLIPTPGQAEQEYLAVHMHQQKLAFMANQKDFSLQNTLETLTNTPVESIPEFMDQYRGVIEDFTKTLKISG